MGVLSRDLPLGFRFRPTDEEIIIFLWRKNSGKGKKCSFIPDVPFLKLEPWDLPAFSGIKTKDRDWYFFSQQDLKHRNGKQSNRTTEAGYWKVTGKEQQIQVGKLTGKKRILVFYQGRSKEFSKGERTNWVTHEYQIILEDGKTPSQIVLCHLFDRSNENRNGKSGHTKSKPLPVSMSPLLEVLAEDIQTSNECLHPEDFVYNAFATAIENELQEETNLWTPSTSLPNMAAVSSPPTAKSSPGEAEPSQARASVSTALGEEASNPAIRSDGTATPNSAVSTMFKDIGDYLFAMNNQVAGATPDEVVDLDMSDVPPESPAWRTLFSVLQSEMQEEIDCTSQPVTDVLNCHQVGVTSQHGANQSAANISFSPDDVLSLDDLNKNHIGDDEITRKDQVSGVAAGEVADSGMSDVPPEPQDLSSKVSVCHSEMQTEVARMSQPVTDDLNSRQVGVPSEYGTIQSATGVSFSRDDVLFLNDLNENNICDDGNTGKNQVTGVAADEMVDSNMSDVVPESPWLSWVCSSELPSLSTEMQKDSGYSWNCDNLESLLWGPFQVSPNRLHITAFGDPISDNPDEVLQNDPSSQKNIAFDAETQENMESIKDNGPTVHGMQKKPNALLDPTSQDSMWSEAIYGKTSSGSLHTLSNNYVGGSSIRSSYD